MACLGRQLSKSSRELSETKNGVLLLLVTWKGGVTSEWHGIILETLISAMSNFWMCVHLCCTSVLRYTFASYN